MANCLPVSLHWWCTDINFRIESLLELLMFFVVAVAAANYCCYCCSYFLLIVLLFFLCSYCRFYRFFNSKRWSIVRWSFEFPFFYVYFFFCYLFLFLLFFFLFFFSLQTLSRDNNFINKRLWLLKMHWAKKVNI